MPANPTNIFHVYTAEHSSFRDNSGFVFYHKGKIFRAIEKKYSEGFDLLQSSGLYNRLCLEEKLIPHTDVKEAELSEQLPGMLIISPEKIPFISYPYEWCFSQLKEAALLTLHIQRTALEHNLCLKDASVYNVQFRTGRPLFIDTLSFEKYQDGSPWVAYRQFCRHFLAPLALMHYKGHETSKMMQMDVDGINLNLASSLLPSSSYFSTVVAAHIHAHSKFQKSGPENPATKAKTVFLSKSKLLAMIEHLEDGISGFKLKVKKTTWDNYEKEHNYTDNALKSKEELVGQWLNKVKPSSVWDCGCNTGKFSEIASLYSPSVISLDSDANCIEYFFGKLSGQKKGILPLIFDFNNPSPAIGWANIERKELGQRGKAGAILALALVHHLRIANNVPWNYIQKLFRQWLQADGHLIIEYIKKEDSQVQRLLTSRKDIFEDYDFASFINEFSMSFELVEKAELPGSARILCLMKAKV